MFLFPTRERYRAIDDNYKLALVRLVFSFGTSAVGTVWSLYMHAIGFSDSTVGYITGGAVFLSLVLTLASTPILEFFQARRLLIFSLLLYTVSYVLAGLSTSKVLFVLVAVGTAIAVAIRTESFAILFRDTTSREKLSQREGLMYALVNLGWLVTPVFAGFLLARYGFPVVFFLSAAMFFVSMLMLVFSDMLRARKTFSSIDTDPFVSIKTYLARREMWYPYAVKFGLNAASGFVLVYLPIFLVERGASPAYIGAMISIMAAVHVLFDFKIGKIARPQQFKSFFVFGFVSSAVLLVWASFIQNPDVLLAVVPLAGVATLFVEPLQDTFFFSLIEKSEDEERLYPVYSTAAQLGGFVAKVLAATVLLFASEQFAYIAIALVLFAIAGIVARMRTQEVLVPAAVR